MLNIGHSSYQGRQCFGWWRGVAATHCVESTQLLYGGPS